MTISKDQLTTSVLRAMHREPEPMRVWCRDCNAYHAAGQHTQGPIPAHVKPVERVGAAAVVQDSGNGGAEPYIDKWLPCIPPTRTIQQKQAYIIKGAKPRIGFYDKKEVKEAMAQLRRILSPIVPDKPLEGPLALMITFVFPWQKTASKKEKESGKQPHTTRLDCDNLAKGLSDQMTKLGFWHDDSQIYDLHVLKFRGNEPGISIRITK